MACAGLNTPAMTLGQARGAVLLGQPLNLTASIQLEPQDVASVLCFDADVFYGDTRLEASQVRVKSEQMASASTAVVRVESPVRVDEPIVTVYLRAGCEQADADNSADRNGNGFAHTKRAFQRFILGCAHKDILLAIKFSLCGDRS